MSDRTKALLFINLSVLTGFSGPLYKAIGFSVTVTAAGRAIFSALALLVFTLAVHRSIRIQSKRELLAFVLGGMIQTVHWLSTIASTKYSTVALGTMLFSTFPLFIIFLEPILFKTKFRSINFLFAIMIIAGVAIMMPNLDFKNRYMSGMAAGIASSLTYALLVLNNKQSCTFAEPLTVVLYNHLFASLFLCCTVFFSRESISLNPHDLILTAVLGVVATALSYTFFVASLKNLSAQVAGICSMFESVYGILLAFLFLHEIPSVRECIGGSVILITIIIFQMRQKQM